MPQQKGMKRARKVLERKQRVRAKEKVANIRRTVRQAEVAAKEEAAAK